MNGPEIILGNGESDGYEYLICDHCMKRINGEEYSIDGQYLCEGCKDELVEEDPERLSTV